MSCWSFANGAGGTCIECAEQILDGRADFEDYPCDGLVESGVGLCEIFSMPTILTRGALAQLIRAARAADKSAHGDHILQALADDLGVLQILALAFPEKELTLLELNASLPVKWPK